MTHDLVVRGGLVADGRGGEPVPADVAVDGSLVSVVGRVDGSGTEEIDAGGHLVTPGFVDIHTHYDGQVLWDTELAPSSWHGVTTAVMGNCGVGFAPVRPGDHERLVELMEGVEDIPGTALHEGLDWSWETFAEYLDAVAARPHRIDVAAQLPHGPLRLYVMGERGARLEAATPEDAQTMRRLAAEAVRAGALGFSTSRTRNHRTATGDPTPSLRAEADELESIVMGLADADAGVVELISDFDDPAAEFAMLAQLVRRSGRPLSLSLAQSHRQPDGWRRLLGMVEAASAEGLPVRAQVAPRQVGLLLGLQGSLHPFTGHPAFRPLAGLALPELVTAMRRPEVRAALTEPAGTGWRIDWDRVFPLGNPPCYEPPASASLAAVAAARGTEPLEVAYDLLLEDEGRAFLLAPFSNYAHHDLEACREMLAHPDTVLGLGDGGAHVGMISDASFPTFALAHWGRARRAGRFPVGWLVAQLTAVPAGAVGLCDRGILAPGYRGDLNVIDMGVLDCEAPRMVYDLPAGGKRLVQGARGYVATVVGGRVTSSDGEPTGALPGRLVRGPRPAPQAA